MRRRPGPNVLLALGVFVLALSTFTWVATASDNEVPQSAPGAVTDGVVAFYFHGNARCGTCRTIEAYTGEAVESGFGEALESGALAWRVVNVDEKENKHFIEDFQLTNKSVVLAEYRAGKVVRYKNLDKVWQLVRSKERFVDYIQEEGRAFLEES